MDIYEYLKKDHQKVAKLFELFQTAPSARNKLEIIALLTTELTMHADSEANTFYKILEKYHKSEDEALHGKQEHEEIKEKLLEIAKFKKVDESLEKKILELKNLVEHHVSDEEGKIFRTAKKVISEEEANILKEQMHDYKQKILHDVKMLEEEIIY